MYFHGNEAEQYSFYRIPKMLIKDSCFKSISLEARLLYGLMLDRMSLSVKNQWLDDQNRVYIYYTVESIMEDLGCGKGKCTKILAELDTEKGIGLIERKRQGLGKPDKIYVLNFAEYAERNLSDQTPENHLQNPQRFEKRASESPNIETTDVHEMNANNTDINKTDIIKNNPISHKGETDEMGVMTDYRELVRENLRLDECMEILSDSEKQKLNEIYEIICDVVCVKRETIRIEGNEYPYKVVQSRFLKITKEHALYVMECLEKTTTKINNIRSYLITALYHAPTTFRNYIDQTVQYDMYGGGWQEKGILPEPGI